MLWPAGQPARVCHGLRRKHVQRYLDGFVFRCSRRRHTRTAFDRLLGISLQPKPATYRDSVDGRVCRAGSGTLSHRRLRFAPGFPDRPLMDPPQHIGSCVKGVSLFPDSRLRYSTDEHIEISLCILWHRAKLREMAKTSRGDAGMRISRRTLIAGAVPALLPLSAKRTVSEDVGGRRITTVSDGNLVLPLSFLLQDVPEAQARRFFSEHGLSAGRLEPECNLTLLEDGDRTVLFDAGAGPNFMPTAGLLGDALAEASIEPEAVTDVVFTHAHPDHLWGILDEFDEITFPEAQLHVSRKEWDFWRASDTIKTIGKERLAFAVGAQNRYAAMEDRVQLFDAGAEVVPGVEAVGTSGHTPGHMSFAIHSNSDYVMVLGDALTNHAVSFHRPDWANGSDQNPQAAIATRLSLLDRLSADRASIVGFHLPNGGLGRVERHEQAYRFVQDL